MEEVLKYISLITMSGAAISFIIGLIKWIDQRNREIEQKQYKAFHKMVCIASGVDESGRTIKMVQQIAAIYQLQAYQKYSFASIPVLEHMKLEMNDLNDKRTEHLVLALEKTIEVLSKH
jgi:hypothetical protein